MTGKEQNLNNRLFCKIVEISIAVGGGDDGRDQVSLASNFGCDVAHGMRI